MSLGVQEPVAAKPTPFSTRGIYFHDGFTAEPKHHAPLYWDFAMWQKQIRWLHACGINAIEFATMLEFNRIPSTDLERRKIQDRLRLLDFAHSLEMQFGYLLTNTVLSTVPPNEEPSHQLKNRAVNYCPRIPGNFEKTIANPLFYMETYRHADFFEEFAADWGGCDCGKCGVPEFLRYVRVLAERLTHLNPKATLYADTWCISYWRKEPMAQGWKGVFDHEIEGSREVIAALPNLPRNVGIALPCHHLYRPLAFTEYGGKAKTPVFPLPKDIQQVKQAARPSLAWSHFVMDDDAFRPLQWGIVHSEVRYIQNLLQTLQKTGIERVIGNLYLPLLQIANTFAFGRLTANPNENPEHILTDFARLVVQKEDVSDLAQLLIWVENHSYWQQQQPLDARVPDIPNDLNHTKATAIAQHLRPKPNPDLPLPIAPVDWLTDLRRTLERMKTFPNVSL